MCTTDISTQAEIGGYALEMLSPSPGTRTHAIIVAVQDDLVSFWHVDSSGVVHTTSQDWLSPLSDFEWVAAVFVALAYCSPEQLGLAGTVKARSQDLCGNVVLRKHTVYSAAAQSTSFGHRTTVYSGLRSARPDPEPEDGGVAVKTKTSLQHEDRKSEVKRSKNHGFDHLPVHAKPWELSDGTHQQFGDGALDRCNRVLRVFVTPMYVPLSTQLARNPGSLKTMVSQMIQCTSSTVFH